MSASTAERAIEGTLDPAGIRELVIAGWAGRDASRVEAHVRELEAEGIPRPPRTPMFYLLSASLLTTAAEITVVGGSTSGEVECLLVSRADGLWVGLGSDHTDRALERTSVAKSKQSCLKPTARTLWRFDDVAPHWDQLELRSFIDVDGTRTPYQSGTAAAMLPPQALLDDLTARGGSFKASTAMFCGTLATLSAIRPSTRFEMELHDPLLRRTIRHGYDVHSLPESL
ncbi:MAG: DUF2848 domain-containing protein [Gemmatimonadales bacterium]